MKAILTLFLALSVSTPASAFNVAAGHDRGNAGDMFTSEFILTARDAIERMKLLPQSELTEIDLNRLAGVVLNAAVHSEENLFLNGYEVDAINYPDTQEIKISRSRWRALRPAQETTNRITLVIHEYLYLIGVNDDQFRLSGRLVPLMNVENFNPNRWWTPLNPANRITLNMDFAPEGCTPPSLAFDPRANWEEISGSTTGNCGEYAREITVTKNSFTAPPSSGARGTFHRYEISVRDSLKQLVGGFTYEPAWGQCLLPQDGSCQLSGKLFVAGLELQFWLMR